MSGTSADGKPGINVVLRKETTVFDRSRVHHGSSVQYAVVEAFLDGSAGFFLHIIKQVNGSMTI